MAKVSKLYDDIMEFAKNMPLYDSQEDLKKELDTLLNKFIPNDVSLDENFQDADIAEYDTQIRDICLYQKVTLRNVMIIAFLVGNIHQGNGEILSFISYIQLMDLNTKLQENNKN